jgi:hypothetical protein
MESEYLDLKQLSIRTGLSPRTIRYWVHDPVNPLPAYRPRNKLLFKWHEVERWIARARVTNPGGFDCRALLDEVASECGRTHG